jgi:hypothetical protein
MSDNLPGVEICHLPALGQTVVKITLPDEVFHAAAYRAGGSKHRIAATALREMADAISRLEAKALARGETPP